MPFERVYFSSSEEEETEEERTEEREDTSKRDSPVVQDEGAPDLKRGRFQARKKTADFDLAAAKERLYGANGRSYARPKTASLKVRHKHRYKDIAAADDSRFVLKKLLSETSHDDEHPGCCDQVLSVGGDYINADKIPDPFTTDKTPVYIAAQGPLYSTVEDTWRAIWDSEAENVVMLTRLFEAGHVKCAHYLPVDEFHPQIVRLCGCKDISYIHDLHEPRAQIRVVLVSEETVAPCLTKKVLDMTLYPGHHFCGQGSATRADNEPTTRRITHFDFNAWPDRGLPDVVDFKCLMDNVPKTSEKPIVVHCSAGIGRTGTFCAIHAAEARDEYDLDIVSAVVNMRRQRFGMVQTDEQLQFICDYLDAVHID